MNFKNFLSTQKNWLIFLKVLEHSVGPWEKGEHFVLAHFMKDDVHDRVGVARPPFPVQGDFLHLVGSEDKPKKWLRKK